MQLNLIGPSWVRWYVSDFGFVGFGTLLALLVHTTPSKQKGLKVLVKKIMRLTVIMFVLAVTVEMFQMEADKIARERNLVIPTAGDLVDIALYVYSFLLNIWLIIKAALYEQRLFVSPIFYRSFMRCYAIA